MKKKTGQKGFSMVELIIVVAIIAILAVVGVQAFGSIQATAKKNVAKSNATLLAGAINQYNAIASTDIASAALTGTATQAALKTLFSTTDTTAYASIKEPVFTTDKAVEAAVKSVNLTSDSCVVAGTLYDAEDPSKTV